MDRARELEDLRAKARRLERDVEQHREVLVDLADDPRFAASLKRSSAVAMASDCGDADASAQDLNEDEYDAAQQALLDKLRADFFGLFFMERCPRCGARLDIDVLVYTLQACNNRRAEAIATLPRAQAMLRSLSASPLPAVMTRDARNCAEQIIQIANMPENTPSRCGS